MRKVLPAVAAISALVLFVTSWLIGPNLPLADHDLLLLAAIGVGLVIIGGGLIASTQHPRSPRTPRIPRDPRNP